MGSSWVALGYQSLGAVEILGIDVRILGGLAALAGLCGTVWKLGGDLTKWLGRPRLRLTFDSGSQPVDATMYWNEQFPRAKLSMIRLDLYNAGSRPAEGVLVKVARVRAPRDGVFVVPPEYRRLRNLPLAWADEAIMDPTATSEPRDIAADDTERVDLVHVIEALPEELHLDTRPRLQHDPQWLKDLRVTLDLTLTATNHSTRHYVVEVDLLEPWSDPAKPARFAIAGPRQQDHAPRGELA